MHAHALRLPPGADLKAELTHFAEAHGLRAACILSCAGSLSRARLRMPGGLGEAEAFRTFEEPMEIVSLTGTISPDGLHVHVALARRDGVCVGGHLSGGCIVHTTAELVVGELADVEFRRLPDPSTGYHELAVSPRAPNDDPSVT